MTCLNNQEIFDKVSEHLINQGCKSVSVKDNNSFCCMYRGKNGNMCAVGCLIPDELYSPDMENKSPEYLLNSFPVLKKILKRSSISILTELQTIHDNCPIIDENTQEFEMRDLIEQLIDVRYKFRLHMPPVIQNYLNNQN
jgi:hypothetical protein